MRSPLRSPAQVEGPQGEGSSFCWAWLVVLGHWVTSTTAVGPETSENWVSGVEPLRGVLEWVRVKYLFCYTCTKHSFTYVHVC